MIRDPVIVIATTGIVITFNDPEFGSVPPFGFVKLCQCHFAVAIFCQLGGHIVSGVARSVETHHQHLPMIHNADWLRWLPDKFQCYKVILDEGWGSPS